MATGRVLKQHLAPFSSAARVDGHRQQIVFRLPDLEFIDVTGLNALLTAWEGADEGIVTIREPSRSVRRLLALVGLESLIEEEQRLSYR